MLAASCGKADTVRVLLKAGASTEAKDYVSKGISICTSVCVWVCYIFRSYKSVVLFSSYILLL